MSDSNETIAYENGYDSGYVVGFDDGVEKGKTEVMNYLVENGYIKYGFYVEYLAEQLKEL